MACGLCLSLQTAIVHTDVLYVCTYIQSEVCHCCMHCRLLLEMFPEVLANEIHDVFVAMEMDVDRTVEYLLNDRHQQMRHEPEESECLESVGSVSK